MVFIARNCQKYFAAACDDRRSVLAGSGVRFDDSGTPAGLSGQGLNTTFCRPEVAPLYNLLWLSLISIINFPKS